ncbi:hypothetical protein ILUMI_16194 [Ignelater luminosus]|uniref:Uncharacterized protein n=1 Tax=Ignelater luminosus TaxID=2038154 RepID=A0A8K0G8F4_IGNLU|nr:hypothetical protein ILUMI_16194 [Ignelater luminosus]
MDKNGRLMIGAPPGSVVPHESGFNRNESCLLDFCRASHKELAVIEYAHKFDIHLLNTLLHTTHKLQPLDRTFFKPFKAAFATVSSAWIRRNPAAGITDSDIAALVDEAFSRAARLDIAENGFKCTGSYLFNPEIFTATDFLQSLMTDVAQEVASKEDIPNQPSANTTDLL